MAENKWVTDVTSITLLIGGPHFTPLITGFWGAHLIGEKKLHFSYPVNWMESGQMKYPPWN